VSRGAAGRAWILALLVLGAPGERGVQAAPADAVAEERVTAIASQLRCVVCQNLSVADSPSEMARQMRDLIRERLAAGDTPAEIRAYFVERYGEWVLLAPPPRGLNLVLWLSPFGALLGGLGVALGLARRWRRRARATATPVPAVDARERERIAAELARFRD
jgi:cytochrome c-type biogenesis protein CcmH